MTLITGRQSRLCSVCNFQKQRFFAASPAGRRRKWRRVGEEDFQKTINTTAACERIRTGAAWRISALTDLCNSDWSITLCAGAAESFRFRAANLTHLSCQPPTDSRQIERRVGTQWPISCSRRVARTPGPTPCSGAAIKMTQEIKMAKRHF